MLLAAGLNLNVQCKQGAKVTTAAETLISRTAATSALNPQHKALLIHSVLEAGGECTQVPDKLKAEV